MNRGAGWVFLTHFLICSAVTIRPRQPPRVGSLRRSEHRRPDGRRSGKSGSRGAGLRGRLRGTRGRRGITPAAQPAFFCQTHPATALRFLACFLKPILIIEF